MAKYEELVDRLFEFEAERDEGRRRELSQQILTDDIEFYGVTGQTVGREEFETWFRSDGDTQLVRTSGVEHHRGWLRNTWELREADGTPARLEDGEVFGGLQISQLSDDGRFRRLIAFRGDRPPISD